MSFDKLLHISPIRRLNVFLEYIEMGGSLEIDGFNWCAGEDLSGNLIPCIVIECNELKDGVLIKKENKLSNPEATISYLLNLMKKWPDEDLMGVMVGKVLTQMKRGDRINKGLRNA